MANKDMDKLVNHAKTSGFVYQGILGIMDL